MIHRRRLNVENAVMYHREVFRVSGLYSILFSYLRTIERVPKQKIIIRDIEKGRKFVGSKKLKKSSDKTSRYLY